MKNGGSTSIEVQKCTSLYCVENGEKFYKTTYNDVSIIYRDSDKYINASKLCGDGKKMFQSFKRLQRWRNIVEYWNLERGTEVYPASEYELKGKFDKSRGTYIHPELIHFVADWISLDYAFKVSKIMNLINERNQLTKQTLDDTITTLQTEVLMLKEQIKHKDELLLREREHNKDLKDSNQHFINMMLRDNKMY